MLSKQDEEESQDFFSFKWGKSGRTYGIPNERSERFLKDEIITYLSDDADKSGFRSNLKTVLRESKVKGKTELFQQVMSKLLKEVLQNKEVSYDIFKSDTDAWSDYIKGESGKKLEEIARGFSLYDVFSDNENYLKMVGSTGFNIDIGNIDTDTNIPKLDFKGFLREQELSEVGVYDENPIETGYLYLKPLNKRATQQYLNQKDDEEIDVDAYEVTEEFIDTLLFENPHFLENLSFSVVVKKEDNEEESKYTITVPETPSKGFNNLKDEYIDYYIDFIRDKLGIDSGGFIPAGKYYTDAIGDILQEKSLGITKSFKISNIIKPFNTNAFIENIKKIFMSSKKTFLEQPTPIDIINFDNKKILEGISKNDYVENQIEGMKNLRSIKFFKFNAKFRNNYTFQIKKFSLEKIANEIQNYGFTYTMSLKELKIGQFDFSVYSKKGIVRKDKMNDHLSEIRTKLNMFNLNGINWEG